MKAGLRIDQGELRQLFVDDLALLTPDEFEAAISLSNRLEIPLERLVADRGRVPYSFVLTKIGDQWHTPYTDLHIGSIQPDALRYVREEFARSRALVPFLYAKAALHVAMVDPRDEGALSELSRASGAQIIPYLASAACIHRAQLLYRGDLRAVLRRTLAAGPQSTMAAAGAGTEPGSAPELLRIILEYAALTSASDIHIEPYEHETLIRVRVDGVLHDVLSEPPVMIQPLTTRIKALARMRVDDRRSPQDGRFSEMLGPIQLDLRVSSMPSQWGEKVVMRLLAGEDAPVDVEVLGLATDDRATIKRHLMRPHGMILVTGPTGSGKSTTMYAMLAKLGAERMNLVNISTIEDPVEQRLPRVTQVTLNPQAGMDYAQGLRALLRQDPDVIMVGEMRDAPTVDISVRAALAGRLLLSTLHTNDAPTAIPRLLDMGAEPYLVSSTLSLVGAQRLVRRICSQCCEEVEPAADTLNAVRRKAQFTEAIVSLRRDGIVAADGDPLGAVRFFHGRGCATCNNTGFRGRVGLFELLEIDDDLRRLILQRADASAIRAMALRNGMRSMFHDGMAKVLAGQTTLSELLRTTT